MGIKGIGEGGRDYSVSVNYTIRNGDNLTIISRATDIPVSVLVKDNNIKDPNKIFAGQTIVLRYHPGEDEAFNSPKMNDMYPNLYDQEQYFEDIDASATERYTRIERDGAQKHLDTKW